MVSQPTHTVHSTFFGPSKDVKMVKIMPKQRHSNVHVPTGWFCTFTRKGFFNFHLCFLLTGDCDFHAQNALSLYLTPRGLDNLMLVLTSHSVNSISQDLLRLAIPTIPPMTRSPFSNLVPDYVILSPEINQKGPGGYLCSGFWDNSWNYDPVLSTCFC